MSRFGSKKPSILFLVGYGIMLNYFGASNVAVIYLLGESWSIKDFVSWWFDKGIPNGCEGAGSRGF